jgi:hypothetical protein
MSLVLSGTNGLSDVDGSAATPAIRGTDTNTGIFFPAADTIAFAEGGAEVARFDASGNFGLGVTPSAWGSGFKALQIGARSSLTGTAANSYYLGSNWFQDAGGTNRYIASAAAQTFGTDNDGFVWRVAPSGTAGNAISFTQAMTLDASGNLLVGATSPTFGGSMELRRNANTANLDIYAAGDASSSNIAKVRLYSNLSNGAIGMAGDALVFYNASESTERMRLNAAGNLGIGATPSPWGSFNRALQVVGAALSRNDSVDAKLVLSNNAYRDNGSGWRYMAGTFAAAMYQQGFVTGNHEWYTAPQGTAGSSISFTQAMTLNTNGNLALQGATTSANGVGITFPATQVASSDANALDDYEEGTWTPTAISGGTISVVGSTAATYTKIGRQVTVSAYINMSSIPNNGSTFLIGGLPFATSGLTTFAYGAGAISYSGTAVTSDFGGPLVFPNSNALYFHFLSGSNAIVSNATLVSRGITEVLVSFTYFVA